MVRPWPFIRSKTLRAGNACPCYVFCKRMTYLLWIAYKGTNYGGFQVQPNAPTVCAAVQDAMQRVLGCRPDVKGCSRTDAGVHARRFALSFCYTGKVPAEKMVQAFNAHLPPDIRAVDIRSVPDGFHARYAAHAKTYRYYILNARVDDPFTYDTCHRVGAALNLAAMQAAAAQFIGTHDFSALCASGSSAAAHGDTVRTITDCTVVQNGDLFTISVTADGYLYNMVRILAGTLADAGLGKRTPESIPALLERQVQSSVYLEDSIRAMEAAGVDTILEIGPGKALSAFVKKTAKDIKTLSVDTAEDLEAAVSALKGAAQ